MGRGVWEAAGCAKACPTTKKADALKGRGVAGTTRRQTHGARGVGGCGLP